MITIDGYTWPIPCDVERTAEVTPSEISGMMLDKSYFNDVIGTFMKYDVTLAVPPSMENDYTVLYETLTAPIDGHEFVMPYGQSDIEVTARVDTVKDVLVYTASAKQYWRGIKFSVTANHPSKYESLGTVVTRGRTPMPAVMDVEEGASFVKTEDDWELLADADERYY